MSRRVGRDAQQHRGVVSGPAPGGYGDREPVLAERLERERNAARQRTGLARRLLVGYEVADVTVNTDGRVSLVMRPAALSAAQRPEVLWVEVMRDPEGNGPGTLWVTGTGDVCEQVGGR